MHRHAYTYTTCLRVSVNVLNRSQLEWKKALNFSHNCATFIAINKFKALKYNMGKYC